MNDTDATRGAAIESTAGGCYGNGWKALKRCFAELLVVVVICTALAIPTLWARSFGDRSGFVSLGWTMFGLFYWLLIAGPATYGAMHVHLLAARGARPRVKDMLAVQHNYGNVVVAQIVCAFLIGVGTFFLVVPGIVLACRLAFVPYLVVDRRLEAMAAIKESWRLTRGHGITIFAMGLLAAVVSIAGLFVFVVGVLAAWIWIWLSFASLFIAVAGREVESA